jgi:predicted nucleic acid-binding protein
VKVYVDTNIVVADTMKDHVHHVNAAGLFRQIQLRQWTPVIAAHGLAEIYLVLTGAPYKPRPTPAAVGQMIEKNVLQTFEIEALTRNDYKKIIQECAVLGWTGGRVYDAIHIHAARKAQCSRIYTFDVQDFRQLAPDLLDRILSP